MTIVDICENWLTFSSCQGIAMMDLLLLRWRQDNGNRSNQESKFDFLATHQCLVKIDEGLGWCQEREKIDWQEPGKFDCWLVWMIFIFVVLG